MIEIGKILRIEQDKAVVVLDSSEHCEKCRLCFLDSDGQRTLKVYNSVGAKVGDRVEIFIPVGMLSKLSFSVFVFPIVAFLIGYWIVWGLSHREMLGAIGGAIAFVLTFYALWLYEKKLSEIKRDTLPYISKILNSKEE